MKIEVLYPEIANLYGDLMNVTYLSQCTGAEICYTHLKDMPRFLYDDVALVFLACTTEQGQVLVRNALSRNLSELRKHIESGRVFLATGNALEIFGKYIEMDNGDHVEMLGLFDYYSTQRLMNRYNSLYLGNHESGKIIGFKSQFGHSYGYSGENLFETVRGAGLNPEVKGEGIKCNGFLATYVEGPILVMNPYFNIHIQRLMGIMEPTLAYEEAQLDMYNTRLAEFSEPKRGFVY